jgi:hypothetical protein
VVQIRRRLESGGVEFVVVVQPDGSFASLPAWMTESAASRFEQGCIIAIQVCGNRMEPNGLCRHNDFAGMNR